MTVHEFTVPASANPGHVARAAGAATGVALISDRLRVAAAGMVDAALKDGAAAADAVAKLRDYAWDGLYDLESQLRALGSDQEYGRKKAAMAQATSAAPAPAEALKVIDDDEADTVLQPDTGDPGATNTPICPQPSSPYDPADCVC
jgi:hypothetical protein